MATSNSEWLQVYQNNFAGPSQQTNLRWSDDVVTHATTVTTTTTTSSSSVSNQLGRVIRPNNMRRRSRASRKTPTTLFNTDTTNFRAMVQQITGGTSFMTAHATTAPSRPLGGGYNVDSFGSNYYGTGSRILPATSSYNVEFLQPQHQQYYTMAADGDRASGDHQHGFCLEATRRFKDTV
ncbi:uncharacterized protein [Rutidosis leptorrhynchoides]|uniref:uncharacterized protein n=1 Tax=Rutidosis leptorrhynchoides TaxID=125765 RepID=UPI003A991CA5